MSAIVEYQKNSDFLGIGKKAKNKRVAKKAATVKPSAASPDFVVRQPAASIPVINATPTKQTPEVTGAPIAPAISTGNIETEIGEGYKEIQSTGVRSIQTIEDVVLPPVVKRKPKEKNNTLLYVLIGAAVLVLVIYIAKKKK